MPPLDSLAEVQPHPPQDARALANDLRAALRRRDEILFAYLHGSLAAGLPFRDVDVAVYLRPDRLSALDALDYQLDLATALTRQLKLPTDIRVLNDAPRAFQHAVLQGRSLFTRDAAMQADFIEQVTRDYIEFASLGRRGLEDLLRP